MRKVISWFREKRDFIGSLARADNILSTLVFVSSLAMYFVFDIKEIVIILFMYPVIIVFFGLSFILNAISSEKRSPMDSLMSMLLSSAFLFFIIFSFMGAYSSPFYYQGSIISFLFFIAVCLLSITGYFSYSYADKNCLNKTTKRRLSNKNYVYEGESFFEINNVVLSNIRSVEILQKETNEYFPIFQFNGESFIFKEHSMFSSIFMKYLNKSNLTEEEFIIQKTKKFNELVKNISESTKIKENLEIDFSSELLRRTDFRLDFLNGFVPEELFFVFKENSLSLYLDYDNKAKEDSVLFKISDKYYSGKYYMDLKKGKDNLYFDSKTFIYFYDLIKEEPHVKRMLEEIYKDKDQESRTLFVIRMLNQEIEQNNNKIREQISEIMERKFEFDLKILRKKKKKL